MPILIRRLWLMVLLLSGLTNAFAENNPPVIAIIANRDVLRVSSDELGLIYWRKQLYWEQGQRIKPVNLRPEHPLRQQFSQIILGSPPKKQIDYWNGQYFNGILPPYSVNSEEAVLRYVAQTIGAIGYVEACHVDNRVKAIMWIINNQVTIEEPAAKNCAN